MISDTLTANGLRTRKGHANRVSDQSSARKLNARSASQDTQHLACTSKGKDEVKTRRAALSARQRQFLLLVDKTDSISREVCQKLAQTIDIEQLIDLGLVSTANKVAQERTRLTGEMSVVTFDEPDEALLRDDEALSSSTLPARVSPQTALGEPILAVAASSVASEKTQPNGLNQDIGQALNKPKLDGVSKAASPSKADITLDDLQVEVGDVLLRVKLIMIESLRLTNGLLAAGLIRDIERANSLTVVKQYSAKWRMTMLDSRYDKQQIDIWYAQVKNIFEA